MSCFFMCSTQALQADISPTSFKVYCYYAISANNKTRASHKSKYTIAKDCGISRSTLLRATKELCDHRLLKVEKRFDNGRQIPNRYILTDTPGQTALFSFISPLSVEPSKLPRSGNKALCGAAGAFFRCDSDSFPSLTALELKIYAYLSMRMDELHQCFPAKKEISAICRTSLSSVSRAIRKIEAAGLLKVIPQNRKNRSGNHGTSANLYRHCKLWVRRVLFLALFFAQMTPSPMSPVKHQRTTSMKKVTLKQRKEKIISKVPKCMNLHLLAKYAGRLLHHVNKTQEVDIPLCDSS